MCLIVECVDIIGNWDTQRFRNITDRLSASFLYATTTFFVVTQMLYVVPQVYDTGGVMYKLGWLTAIFITYNILGNMSACTRTDTSVRSLPCEQRFSSPADESLWRYCDTCERFMPPRSWHCKVCKCCILKRSHHCIFTANCVGHNNQRYFFWFTFYMTLGLLLALGNTIIFMLKNYDYFYVITWIWPVAIYLDEFATGASPPNWLGLTIMFNAYILLAPLVMFMFQMVSIWRNTVVFDLNNDSYDLGLRKNFMSILGQRGLWTFLSPTVKSPLSHDGTKWPEKPLKVIISIR
ncbi:hypothetical protein KR038_005379 [Drosophila bunnanda]|nr:hypothetical protein KR038_005379 [Drosophila bunnanda]